MIGRRGFITGLVSLVAAPAIVRVASIMPVKVMEFDFTTYGRYIIKLDPIDLERYRRFRDAISQPFPDEFKLRIEDMPALRHLHTA